MRTFSRPANSTQSKLSLVSYTEQNRSQLSVVSLEQKSEPGKLRFRLDFFMAWHPPSTRLSLSYRNKDNSPILFYHRPLWGPSLAPSD